MAIVSLFQKQDIVTEVHSLVEVADIVIIGALVLATMAALTISTSIAVGITWTTAIATAVVLSVLLETEKM